MSNPAPSSLLFSRLISRGSFTTAISLEVVGFSMIRYGFVDVYTVPIRFVLVLVLWKRLDQQSIELDLSFLSHLIRNDLDAFNHISTSRTRVIKPDAKWIRVDLFVTPHDLWDRQRRSVAVEASIDVLPKAQGIEDNRFREVARREFICQENHMIGFFCKMAAIA